MAIRSISLTTATDQIAIPPDVVRRPVTSEVAQPQPPPITTPPIDVVADPDITIRRSGGAPVFGLGGDAVNPFRVETTLEGQRTDAFGNVIGGSSGLTNQAFGIVAKGDEAKAAAYEAAQAEKNSAGALLGEVVKPFKNLAAGLINGIVPGSNLGDANDPFRTVGEIAAGVTPLGIVANKLESLAPVAKAVEKVETITEKIESSKMALSLGTLISKANDFIASPLGQIAQQAVIPATGPKSMNAGLVYGPIDPNYSQFKSNSGVGSGVGQSPLLPDPTILTSGGPVGIINQPKGTSEAGTQGGSTNNTLVYVGIGIALLFLLSKK